MDLKLRRVIYLSFILAFAASGTLLILYLQGFRYNTQRGQVERTGAIATDSIPDGATVVISGTVQRNLTPTTVQPLRPSDYDVVLTFPGFQSWHKQLKVTPSQVVFTGTVRLWPLPQTGERLSGTALSATILSPNHENLLYRTPTGLSAGLWLLNLATGKTALITRLAGSVITNISWAPSSREFLVSEQGGSRTNYQIYNLERNEWTAVELPNNLSPTGVRWGEDKDELLIITPTELYVLNRNTATTKLLWRAELLDVRAHDNLIFGLARGTGGSLQLKALNRRNLQLVPLDESLPLSTSLEFLEARGKWLPLFDHDRHTLYLLNSPLKEPKYVRRLPEVTALDWSTDGEHLLLTNNFEIWEYQVSDDKLNLWLRLSNTLTQARQVPAEPYVVYGTGNEVWALELDTRPEQQRWKLATYTEEVQDLFLGESADTLTVKTAGGLYRLKLTPKPNLPVEPPASSPAGAIQKFLRQSTRLPD